MVKKLLLAVVAILLLLVGVVATRPAEFHVERVATIAASPADLYAVVSDFRQWPRFSPWAKLDPNQQETHSGSPSGKGAGYAWKGNSDVGEGRMTITDVKPNESITIKLEFLVPFPATNTTTFTFKATDDGRTTVTWAMDGTNGFMGKAFGLIVDMDTMVGKDFAGGLADLGKSVEAEVQARKAAAVPAAAPAAPAEDEAQPTDGAIAEEVGAEAGAPAPSDDALAAQPADAVPAEADPDGAPAAVAPDEAVAAPTE